MNKLTPEWVVLLMFAGLCTLTALGQDGAHETLQILVSGYLGYLTRDILEG